MPDQEQLDDFLEALEQAGSPAKNPALRQALDWEQGLYEEVKSALVTRGIVKRGKGRSDSVSLVGAEPVAAQTPAARTRCNSKAGNNSTANLGFEAKLWLTADKLRNNMDAAEYKHVVLGLIFLKYISDSFEEQRAKLLAGEGDYEGANPPFNDSDWFRKNDDVRWRYGIPPKGNANFAWVQHFIHHLAPQGMAGFVLANGSMSSNQSGEGEIRRALIEADLVDCMVALPGQLFYSTQIPVCLWFLAKSKAADGTQGFRDRRGHTLFIDARKLGSLIDRVHRELLESDLERISSTYHRWRGANSADDYADVTRFCKSATAAKIAEYCHVLTPGRYVGAELEAQFAESARLEAPMRANLKNVGFKP